MNIESLATTNGTLTPRGNTPAEQIDTARSKKQAAPEELVSSDPKNADVQQEELIGQIKSITENGQYSVQFENNENNLIVKVIDRETDEVIRQIPAEELLALTENMHELQGNYVNTKA